MRSGQKAFSLIELMVTISVLGVLTALALPNFNSTINNNRSLTLGTDVVAALNYARGEAIKRGGRVAFCPSTTGTTCGDATEWAKGWLVLVDTATANNATAVLAGTPLKYWNDINASAVMTVKSGGAAVNFVRFTSTGALGSNDSNPRVIVTRIKKCKGDFKSTISVGLAGMINTTRSACP